MTALAIVLASAALLAHAVYQLRVSFDASEAREHEREMLRLAAEQARDAEITTAAATVARTDLTAAETRQKELAAATGYKAQPQLLEAYARKYLGAARFEKAPES